MPVPGYWTRVNKYGSLVSHSLCSLILFSFIVIVSLSIKELMIRCNDKSRRNDITSTSLLAILSYPSRFCTRSSSSLLVFVVAVLTVQLYLKKEYFVFLICSFHSSFIIVDMLIIYKFQGNFLLTILVHPLAAATADLVSLVSVSVVLPVLCSPRVRIRGSGIWT